jgi:hypothetical protein
MSKICAKHEFWTYIKPAQRAKDGRLAYKLLLASTLYNVEHKRFTFVTYVRIHTEHHAILNCLKEYG